MSEFTAPDDTGRVDAGNEPGRDEEPDGNDGPGAEDGPGMGDSLGGELGASCTTNSDCITNSCANGVCCNTPCDGACQTCSLSGECNTAPPAECEQTSVSCGQDTCGVPEEFCCARLDLGTFACVVDTGTGTAGCGLSSQAASLDTGEALWCDEHTDCPINQQCCLTNGNGNLSVSCSDNCPSGTVGGPVSRYAICETPAAGIMPCAVPGSTCAESPVVTDAQGNIHTVVPATWKYCQKL